MFTRAWSLLPCMLAAFMMACTPSFAGMQNQFQPSTHTLDRFNLQLNSEGVLSVLSTSAKARVLWQSLPGVSFVGAGLQQLHAQENRGSFTVTENIVALCEQQTITAIESVGGSVVIRGDVSGNPACASAYTLTFTAIQPGHLQFSLQFENSAVNYTQLRYRSQAEERFYGFGEQFSILNMKGQYVPILSQEGGVGRGHTPLSQLVNLGSRGSAGNALTTYYAVPQYITNTNTSLFLENTDYSVFDLREADRVTVKLFSAEMTGRMLVGDSMLELIERYTEYTGRMRPLPDWFNEGAIVGMQGGTEKVKHVQEALRRRGTPVAGFWLQDWVGKRKTRFGSQLWWNWELDRDHYPDWNGLVDAIEADGGKMLCYLNPFLVDATAKGNVRRNLYQEAVANGYLVKHADGSVYKVTNTDFDAGMIDLTHPDAVIWMKDIIQTQLIGEGRCHGWMHDFAEALPFDAVLYNGMTGAQYHNQYPVEWVRLAREAITDAGYGDSIVFFNRAGAATTPAYSTLLWQGDQLVTWDKYDGFKSAILATLTGGFSGISLTHADIGGYTNASLGTIGYNREQELLLRWMEFSAFTTAFRTHEGLRPEQNAQFYDNETTLAHFDKFARVYKALAFYRKQLFEEARTKGYPVVRHPMLHYPDDGTLAEMKDQIMLGSEILMAPIVNKHAFNNGWNKVYFPDAKNTTWINIFNGNAYGRNSTVKNPAWLQLVNPAKGNWQWVYSPLGQPAAFYRQGSAVGAQLEQNLKQLGVK